MVTRYEAFYLCVIGLILNLFDHSWCSIQNVNDLIWISNEQQNSSLLALIDIHLVSVRREAKDLISLEIWTASVSESSV